MPARTITRLFLYGILLTVAFLAATAFTNRAMQTPPGAVMYRGTDHGTQVCVARNEPLLLGEATCTVWQDIDD